MDSDSTVEMDVLTTREIERVRSDEGPGGWGRRAALAATLGVAAVASWALWPTPVEIRDLEVRPGIERWVVTFRTSNPVTGALEWRPAEEAGGGWERVAAEIGPRREHGLGLEPRPGWTFRVVAGETPGLAREVPGEILPFEASLEVLEGDATEPRTVRVRSRPPTRGRLVLPGADRERAVPLEGPRGDQRGRVPAPEPGERTTVIIYRGEGLDGAETQVELPLLRAGPRALALRLRTECERAWRRLEELVDRPAGSGFVMDALGDGAARRPPARDWLEEVAELRALAPEAAAARRPLREELRRDPRGARETCPALARAALVEAAFRLDVRREGAEEGLPRMALDTLHRALHPPPELGEGDGRELLDGPVSLSMKGSGIVPAFQTDVTYAARLELGDLDPAGRYALVVESEPLREDLYLALAVGPWEQARELRFGSGTGAGLGSTGRGTERYGIVVPGAWLDARPLRLWMGFVPGAPAGGTVRVTSVRWARLSP